MICSKHNFNGQIREVEIESANLFNNTIENNIEMDSEFTRNIANQDLKNQSETESKIANNLARQSHEKVWMQDVNAQHKVILLIRT